jgi:LacI family transcriptional regulator
MARSTITDVAQLAGVSISTVSRVLNGTGPVAAETVLLVRNAMDKLNYKPMAAARTLAGRRTNTVGLLVPELTGEFFMPLLRGIEEGVHEAGLDLLIHLSSTNGEARMLPLDEHNADGLMIFTGRLSDIEILQLHRTGIPMVLLFRLPPSRSQVPSVMFENMASTQQIVEHLIVVHGRRRIAFLSGPQENEDSYQRELGYRAALAKHGIAIDPVLMGDGGYSDTRAREIVSDWLLQGVEFDGIFAGDDGGAAGALLALRQAGRNVPTDVSVVGFDDLPIAALVDPPLTTVRAPIRAAGYVAANLLVHQIQGRGTPASVELPTQVVHRKSCGCMEHQPAGRF